MLIDFSPLQKVLLQLETSLEYFHSPLANKDVQLKAQFRAASIQAFEYTYDVKVLITELRQRNNPNDVH
ncbi:MAG: hypothetical protein HQK83_17885 [Fibrobacteria bacterium]|nr:hypothetical protein [Fibrobacteria bacterium]